MTLLVDLDGVCVDFVSAACRVHGRAFMAKDWPAGEYDLAKALGIEHQGFWAGIHRQGVEFWRGLKAYGWFQNLYCQLHQYGKIYFVTAPTLSPHSAAGKMLWLKDRFGEGFKDFVITRKKYLLSQAGSILIDDCDKNIDLFEKHGAGKGILFPQIWNSAYEHINGDRVDYVMERVRQLKSGRTL